MIQSLKSCLGCAPVVDQPTAQRSSEEARISGRSPIDRFVQNALPRALQREVLSDAQKRQALTDSLAPKWAKTGLDPKIVQVDPDCAQFLLKTRFAFLMGALNHPESNQESIRVVNDVVEVLVEGVYVPWSEFGATVRGDELRSQNQLIDKNDSNLVWTFVSPRLASGGFIKNDPFNYETPYPIEKLTDAEMIELKALASSDPNNKQAPEAIIQVYTSPEGGMCGDDSNVLNMHGMVSPSHYGCRVITPEGFVYSMSFQLDQGEASVPCRYAIGRSTAGKVVMCDYDEARPHRGRFVTTLPMSKDALEKVFEVMKESKIATFNFANHNCASFSRDMLNAAGYPVDIRITSAEQLAGIFFGFVLDAPGIGTAISWTINKVSSIASTVWNWMPSLIQEGIKFLALPFRIIPRLFFNGIVLASYGFYMTPKARALIDGGSPDTRPIKNFWDFFKSETSYLDTSIKFLRWQLQQHQTRLHNPTATPKIHILPTEE